MPTKERVTVEVPYGTHKMSVQIARAQLAGVVWPNAVTIPDEQQAIRRSLANPIEASPLADFPSGPGKTLVVVNDATRPPSAARVLPLLPDMVASANASFIVATGAHGAPTKDELAQVFGPAWPVVADRALVHDARRGSQMQFIGRTSRGTNVMVNRALLEAKRTVIISSVEPHYFAGYTGARKSLVPGLSAFETIEKNHSLALLPGVLPLALAGNPVHEDMVEAVSFLGDRPIFAINLVLDQDGRTYAVTSGHLHKSFAAAAQKANDIYVVPVERRADVVVSVARYPLDRDLYQLQKALEHGWLAVKRGGVLILVSKCWGGVGEKSYMSMILRWQTPEEVLKNVHKEPAFGCHKAARLCRALLWAKVFAVTDLDASVLKRIFIEPFSFLQAAIDNALRVAGPQPSVLFLMNGGVTVPKVE